MGGNSTSIKGNLNTTPNSTFTLEFFGTPGGPTLRYGDGQSFLGSTSVQTNASGLASFTTTLSAPVSAGRSITATATDVFGNTSEFSLPVTAAATGVASHEDIPHETVLMQNYPNPFNPSTRIRYGLPSRSHVTLTVFNTLSQRVATLVDDNQEAGYYEVRFDGKDLSSGVYLYRIQAGDFVRTRKLLLVK